MKENKKYKNKKEEDEFLPGDWFLSDDEETRVLFSDEKEENLSGDKEDLFFDNEELSLRVKKIVKIIDLEGFEGKNPQRRNYIYRLSYKW